MYEVVLGAVRPQLYGGALWGIGAVTACCALALLAARIPTRRRRPARAVGHEGPKPAAVKRKGPYVGIG